MKLKIVSTGLVIILLTACQTAAAKETETLPAAQLPVQSTQAAPQPIASPAAEIPKIVKLTMQDLAIRLGIAENQITFAGMDPVTWPDASLGCPQPGQVYAQVLVSGYRVRLEANGQVYGYHTDEKSLFILCELDGMPIFPLTPGDIHDGQPWVPVQ